MDRINIGSGDPVLDRLSRAVFSEESRLKNLGVMVSRHSGGVDYVVLYAKPSGLDISPRGAVEWLKGYISRDLPVTEDVAAGTVSQEMNGNGAGKKFVRRYSLFRGDIDEFFAQVESHKYAFEC